MKYKISIVVPVYNAEKYLVECVDTIINQTIGFENLQVILVNDGSKDSSGAIADDFAKKYKNITAIHLEKSHRIGGFARNVGIEKATGEYLMFIDSDDCFRENACELMYNAITENNADIVTANYKCMEENGTPWEETMFDKELYKSGELTEPGERFFYLYCPSVCMKIFNTKMVKKNDIKFLEGVPAEDAYFSSCALLLSKKIYYLEEEIYYYRRRNTGKVSTSWMRNKKYFLDVNFAFKRIYELFKVADKLDYYKYYYAKNLISVTYKFIDSKLITNDERIQLMNEMYWLFEQKKLLNITFVQRSLEILIDYILAKNYGQAIKVCEIISEIRKLMDEVQKEIMSKPQEMILEEEEQ